MAIMIASIPSLSSLIHADSLPAGMDIQGGRDAVKKMKEAGNNQGRVVEIPHAGHHLYLDNPKRTNAMLREEILAAGRSSVSA
jgi:pimeloyl-ACP methyl ester carboxylesterase